MKACKEECYRHYYEIEPTITVLHAAWIVNGYDPRIDKPSYNSRNIDSNYRMIKSHFNLSTADSILSTTEFFEWAINKWPDFKRVLPNDLIANTANAILTTPSFSLNSFSLPEDASAVRKLAIQSEIECQRLASQVEELKQENKQLEADSEWRKRYRKQQSVKAKKPREPY